MVDGEIEVRLPAWLSEEEASDTVADLVARIHRSTELARSVVDLRARARELALRFRLPEPAEISWSSRQARRWGSCTPSSRTIRVSTRLTRVPAYVLDAVILHELSHLVEPGHGPAFRALQDRFPDRARAEGFLEAMSLGCADGAFVAGAI